MVKLSVTLAAAALSVGLILLSVFLRPGTAASPSTTEQSQVALPQHAAFPTPPRGAVVYSRELGGDALALGVVTRRGHVLVQVSVVGPQGSGVSGLAVRLNSARMTPCGSGCYRTSLQRLPTALKARVGSTTWRVSLPATWPPPDARTLLRRAARVWRSLDSLSFHETLASDTHHQAVSSWRIEAPDKVAYQVEGGWAGIVVGERRWDRSPTSKNWRASPQSRLTQPVPAWVRATDAHILGRTTVAGHPAWRVSFFDPGTPAWFTLAIDRRTFHTLDSRMTATSHFMHDVYGSFNSTPPITPPR